MVFMAFVCPMASFLAESLEAVSPIMTSLLSLPYVALTVPFRRQGWLPECLLVRYHSPVARTNAHIREH